VLPNVPCALFCRPLAHALGAALKKLQKIGIFLVGFSVVLFIYNKKYLLVVTIGNKYFLQTPWIN